MGSQLAQAIRTTRTATRNVAIIGSCSASEADLLRLATHGVPDDVAGHWAGSYVVIEVSGETVTVWTDLGGAWPIYTLTADGGVFWSSSSRALAALTAHQLDTERLAVALLAPGVPRLAEQRSMFVGISLVPAGHRAVLSTAGRLDVQSVWRPQRRSADPVAGLRAELSAAVAVRVESAKTPTVDLSGGLDSTTLALLAAERLSPDRTVTGVTVHPAGAALEGDLTYAHLAAQHTGMTHELMPIGPDHAPYSALDAVPITDEPAPSTIAYTRFAAQLDWMHDRFGTDSHMTGDGGDGLLCAQPIMLADLVAGRRLGRALRETIAWARLRRVAVWPLLADAVRTGRGRRTTALRELAHGWRAGRPTGADAPADCGTGWFPAAAIPAWSTRETRELAASLAISSADRSDPVPPVDFTPFVIAELMAETGRTARADVQIAEHHGVPLHNPFMDSRVIDAYLSMPLDARPGPAEYKPLLRRAMADLFPPALAARTTKGSFASDYYQGMRTNLADLQTLADGHLAVLGLVRPARVRQALTLAAAGLPAAFKSVDAVITTEVWLRALHSAPPVPWVSAQTAGGTT